MDEQSRGSSSVNVARFGALIILAWSIVGTSSAQAAESDLETLKAELARLTEMVEAQAAEIEALKQDTTLRVPTDTSLIQLDASPTSSEDADTTRTASRQMIGRVPDDAVVRAGDFDGSIVIPGATASVRIGGYVQADMGYDFDSLGFSDALNLRTVPLDGTQDDGEQVFRSHARYSRLNFDVRDETKFGLFRTFLEVDFFGSGSDFTNNYTPVLRHAAAGIGDLYFGQFWSHFTDLAAFPEGISSPLGQPLIRNPGVRWRTDIADDWRIAIGIEDPTGDLSGDSALLASDSLPNFTGYIEVDKPWGRVRLAGLGLQLESTADSVLAGGLHLSGRLNLPALNKRDNLAFSLQAGDGFAHYYATLANSGLEGVVSDDGSIEATGVASGYLAYQHWWDDRWRSTFKISGLTFDSPAGSDPLALDSGFSVGANLFWSPLDNATFGLEWISADREVVNGRHGEGARLSVLARFDF